MKLSVVLLAVLAVCGTHQVHSVPVPTRGLAQDLEDFLALIPKEEVTELFFQYISEDEDFGEALDYVMSEDFKRLVIAVEAMPEVKSLVKYLQEAGLNVYQLVNKLHDLLGMEHVQPLSSAQYKISGGLAGFIKDVKALLPIEKIQQLFEEKLQTSEEFSALITKLKSAEFQGLVNKLAENPTLQEVIKKLEGKGVNLTAVFDFLSTVLGLKFPHHVTFSLTRNLNDDLNDFLKLVPQKAIEDLFFEYLSEDEDFGEALDYVLSDEFKKLVIDIENMSEVRQLLKFLEESGLDAYEFINKLNDLLGIDRISPVSTFKTRKITGGLPGFIEDVKALLPVDKIEALYKEKLETSKDFANLVERLSSNEFQGLVDRIMANPAMKDLIKRAEAKGVDVQAILDIITKILGIKFPGRPTLYMARNLQDDLNDFLSLVPTAAVQEIFYQYLSEDEDFGEALDYVMSTEFRNLVSEIENTPEVKGLLDFLEESGLQAYKAINTVNDLLGIDRVHPLYNLKFRKITGGLPGFIADVKAILPLKEIEEMYRLKLKTSESFASLVKRLQSKESEELANKIMSNPTVQDLIKRAEAKGVDVQAILDFLTSIFGFEFPSKPVFSLTRNLKDDLNDLLALVPVDKIQDLFYEYLSEDEDFGEALDYVLSDEFKSMAMEIKDLPEIKELIDFLQTAGLDAYGFIEKINILLGLERIDNIHYNRNKITGGLPGFIADVKALLPIEKIRELYQQKLQTSEDFAKLVDHLKSAEFQGLVNKLAANDKLQTMIQKLKTKGVDVQAILDFLTTLLGLKFPVPAMYKVDRNEEVMKIMETIWSMVPIDDIFDVVLDYILEDEDFQKVVKYMLSEDFKNNLIDVEDLEETKAVLAFLNETGVKIYEYLNSLHDLLGIEKHLPLRRSLRIIGGVSGLFKDIWAKLPRDELRALFDEKMETSQAWQEFVHRLEKVELQNLINRLHEHEGYLDILKKLENLGVDFDEVIRLIKTVIGIEFPERPL